MTLDARTIDYTSKKCKRMYTLLESFTALIVPWYTLLETFTNVYCVRYFLYFIIPVGT